MKNTTVGFIKVGGKNYEYKFIPDIDDEEMIFFECKGGNFAQFYPKSEVDDLLADLPELILEARKVKKASVSDRIVFQVSSSDRENIEKKAAEKGFKSTSFFLREVSMTA